jgi:hypothetical protein
VVAVASRLISTVSEVALGAAALAAAEVIIRRTPAVEPALEPAVGPPLEPAVESAVEPAPTSVAGDK